jgi:hypothetical protein
MADTNRQGSSSVLDQIEIDGKRFDGFAKPYLTQEDIRERTSGKDAKKYAGAHASRNCVFSQCVYSRT